MNMRPPGRLAGVLPLALLAVLGVACSSGTSTTSAPATTTTTAPTSTAPTSTAGTGVDPNAPEKNPPGDIPDNQVFVPFTVPAGTFSLKVPEGWSRTEAGGVVTFTDNFNSIRIETVTKPSAPTAASAAAQDVPAVQAQAPGYEAGTVTTVDRRAGKAVRITYRDDSPPNPVTRRSIRRDVERYEFWSNGKEVVLTLAGPKGADNVDPWRIVTDSVTFLT